MIRFDKIALWIRRALIAGAAALSGCAMAPQHDAGEAAVAPGARPFHQTIEIGGRLSVRYQRNGAEEAVHGSFTWSQRPERTTVTLLSPLGQTIALIDVQPGRSTLTMSGQPAQSAADVDTLAAQALGWPLPVAGLRDWLQGRAQDRAGRSVSAAPPAPLQLETRDGWRLTYASWRDDADRSPQNHPRRIDLERSTAQAGPVAIRIVIDTWQPG